MFGFVVWNRVVNKKIRWILLLTKTVFILGLTKILMGVGWPNIIKRSAGSYGIFTVWNGIMVKIVRFL
ncbi:hypothetical protein SA269_11245 [Aggregatibacter actinomycetemcomitans serotype d str. SA269]|nr:hypothetical protein SA269_11245 [Aggregatibacter actinomycetemcomitans serotype d str. SA269]